MCATRAPPQVFSNIQKGIKKVVRGNLSITFERPWPYINQLQHLVISTYGFVRNSGLEKK
jgi:hypothetical protein